MTRSPVAALALALASCWTGSTSPEPAAPAPTPPAPARLSGCKVTADAPVRATSLGEVHVELPAGEQLGLLRLAASASEGGVSSSMQLAATADRMAVSPGVYKVTVDTVRGKRVECEDVAIAAGQIVTVRVLGFEP